MTDQWALINPISFNMNGFKLTDTDFLYYYHIMHLYCSDTAKQMHYAKPPDVDPHGPSVARLLNAARTIFFNLVGLFANQKACLLLSFSPAHLHFILSLWFTVIFSPCLPYSFAPFEIRSVALVIRRCERVNRKRMNWSPSSSSSRRDLRIKGVVPTFCRHSLRRDERRTMTVADDALARHWMQINWRYINWS